MSTGPEVLPGGPAPRGPLLLQLPGADRDGSLRDVQHVDQHLHQGPEGKVRRLLFSATLLHLSPKCLMFSEAVAAAPGPQRIVRLLLCASGAGAQPHKCNLSLWISNILREIPAPAYLGHVITACGDFCCVPCAAGALRDRKCLDSVLCCFHAVICLPTHLLNLSITCFPCSESGTMCT